MKKELSWSFEKPNQARRIEELRFALKDRDNAQLATRTGTKFVPPSQSGGEFSFEYWHEKVSLSAQDWVAVSSQSGKVLGMVHQMVILYYFNTADGSPVQEKYISFAELPDGMFYNQAFQGYTGKVLQQHFGNDLENLEKAALSANGISYPFADRAYKFTILPKANLLLVCWQGDEDFPPGYQILFDASAPSYLPTDAWAIVGSMLTRKLTSFIPPA